MEFWKPIPGYFGIYSASSLGQIRREKRGPRTYPGRIVKPAIKKDGYASVTLYIDGCRKNHKVHQLIANTFLGPRRKLECNHKDKNKSNNNISNLEYLSKLENMRHSFRLGRLMARGERVGTAKLTEDQVKGILNSKDTSKSLCKKFNIHRNTVWNIRSKKYWRHLCT